jgi:hypothetical protein
MKAKKLCLAGMFLLIMGCSSPAKNSTNPVERAGSYIAGAIVTAAVIRALFND